MYCAVIIRNAVLLKVNSGSCHKVCGLRCTQIEIRAVERKYLGNVEHFISLPIVEACDYFCLAIKPYGVHTYAAFF